MVLLCVRVTCCVSNEQLDLIFNHRQWHFAETLWPHDDTARTFSMAPHAFCAMQRSNVDSGAARALRCLQSV